MYSRGPEVLELFAKRSLMDSLSLKRASYPFGESEELYCYFHDVLIGEVLEGAQGTPAYYEAFHIHFDDQVVVKLLPALRKNDYLSIPGLVDFIASIRSLLLVSKDYAVLCEPECDQQEVEELYELQEAIDEIERLCSGATYSGRAFIYRG